MQSVINIILLGDPASGKATQAARLVTKYRLYDFDMGKEVSKPKTKRLYDYAGTAAVGKLTPTRVARDILRNVIAKVPQSRGILFDGHPKMVGEARLVFSLLKRHNRTDPLVIYLTIPFSEAVKRARLRHRVDDSERALRNRAHYYRTQISRVVAFFKEHYTHKKISGLGTRKRVFKRIASCVDEFIREQSVI